MIAGGEIRVHPNIRHDTVEHLKEDVCPGNPRNRASMRKKTGCEQSIDAKNPQTEAGRAVIAEAGRVCHSDAYRNVVQSSSECVNQTLTNASRMTAGGTGSQVFTGSRAERRTLFIDPNSIVHGSVGALNITTGASLEAVYNAANTVTPPPPPPPPEPAETADAVEVKFDSDGNIQREPVAPPAHEAEKSPVQGGLLASMGPSVSPTGEMGWRGLADIKGPIYKSPGAEVNWHLVADWRKDLGIPSDPHFATGSASAGAPKDNNHLHAVIESRFALNGTMVSLPGVNLIATNDQAEKLEQLLIARWGEKAARIYLDSVVYPHLARAATSGEMRTAWDSVVTEGAKSYEAVITAQSPFEKRSVGMKALFQYDPKRAPVQLAAMLSGQTDETMYQMMKAKDERLKTIQNKYKLPDDYQNKTDPASFTPDPGWLTLGDYKDKLAGQKEAFIEASGMSEEDLKAIAKEKKIPYPFDAANIPDNPWAAQKIYNDFRDAVAQKQEKATVFATADVGIQDVNPIYDHPAAGIRSGAQYAPSDALTVSANIYAGAGESHLIQEEPTLLEGKAYAVTGGVAVNPLQSKTRWHRGTMMALELIYSDGNKLPEYFTPHLTLAPTVAFGDNSPVTFTPSLDLYWGLDQEGGADIGLVIGGFKLAYDFGSGTSVYGAYQLKWLSVKDEIQSADAERPGSTLNRPVEGPAETDNALSATAGFTRPQHRGAIGVARGPLSGEFGVVRGAQNNVYNDASEGAGAKAWVDFTLKYRF